MADNLRMRIPRRLPALREARGRFRAWLARCGLGRNEADELVVAVGEAFSNALLHAPPESQAPVEVQASCPNGHVEVRVRNKGRWQNEPRREGGLGLPLMRGLTDEMTIEQHPDSTTVTLRRRFRT